MKTQKLKLKKEVICTLSQMKSNVGQGGADTFHSNCMCLSDNVSCKPTVVGCEKPYTTDPVLSGNNCGETGRCAVAETNAVQCIIGGKTTDCNEASIFTE